MKHIPTDSQEHPPTNREKKLAPRTDKYWCDHCDAAKAGDGSKCPRCGKRQDHRRFKK